MTQRNAVLLLSINVMLKENFPAILLTIEIINGISPINPVFSPVFQTDKNVIPTPGS